MIYRPREDSYLLEKEVRKYSKGGNVLDMGTGSGIQAIAAKKAGAKSVTACDILGEAVKKVHFMGIRTIKSNLFSNVKGKFDLIIFNPPYLPMDPREDKESALSTSGGRMGDEVILRFLKNAKKHLGLNGMILLVISSLTPQKRITELLEKEGLTFGTVASEKLFYETLYVWAIKRKISSYFLFK